VSEFMRREIKRNKVTVMSLGVSVMQGKGLMDREIERVGREKHQKRY